MLPIPTRRLPQDSPIQSEAVEAMRNVRFRIPGNVIIASIRDMIDRGLITDAHATSIQWFAGYCRAKNLGPDQIAGLLPKADGSPYTYDSVYQLLTGRRADQGANVIPLVDAIEAFRAIAEPASRLSSSTFIVTSTTREVFHALDTCRTAKKILPVVGDSQIGKSEIIAEYTRTHNHGATIAIDTPPRGSLAQFQTRLGSILALSNVRRASDLGDTILASFRPGMLLIVDNFHRALRRSNAHQLGDFIQEIHDTSEIGIALFMTREGRDLLLRGPEHKRLQQLWRRRKRPIELPQLLPADDLAKFAHARGLPPAPRAKIGIERQLIHPGGSQVTEKFIIAPFDLQTKVMSEEGLGIWCSILDEAATLAARRQQPITWDAVLTAYCLFT